jgi:hypothetical protein
LRVGKELPREDPGAVDGYAAQLGASARQFADNVEDKNFREIAASAEDFGRHQPPAFLSLAAGAGLAASRLLVSSSPGPRCRRLEPHPVRAVRRAIICGRTGRGTGPVF